MQMMLHRSIIQFSPGEHLVAPGQGWRDAIQIQTLIPAPDVKTTTGKLAAQGWFKLFQVQEGELHVLYVCRVSFFHERV